MCRGYMPAESAVGHHLDAALGQQQVDQHAVVVLGVPDLELAEHRDGPLARAGAAPEIAQGQARLDAQADLAGVALRAHALARCQTLQRPRTERSQRVALVEPAMLQDARELV